MLLILIPFMLLISAIATPFQDLTLAGPAEGLFDSTNRYLKNPAEYVTLIDYSK